jgi:DNA-binding GntR family transcriptional regulator
MPSSNNSPIALSTPVPADASLTSRAYYELRDRIVSLRLAPGTLIPEEALMADLGMSRTPLREALLRLGQERLVVMMPRRGTFVTEVHVGDVGTIYEFRRELEAVAARWAALRRSADDLPEVERLMAELSALAKVPADAVDARSQIVGDQQAHELVYRLCGNPLLEKTLNAYYFQAMRIWFLAAGRVTLEDPFMIDVLQAVVDGDGDAAARHARAHSEAAETAIRAAL